MEKQQRKIGIGPALEKEITALMNEINAEMAANVRKLKRWAKMESPKPAPPTTRIEQPPRRDFPATRARPARNVVAAHGQGLPFDPTVLVTAAAMTFSIQLGRPQDRIREMLLDEIDASIPADRRDSPAAFLGALEDAKLAILARVRSGTA
jgi:hypothetical protein